MVSAVATSRMVRVGIPYMDILGPLGEGFMPAIFRVSSFIAQGNFGAKLGLGLRV